VGPSCFLDSSFHTNVSHLAEVVLPFFLVSNSKVEPPEIGIMVPTDGRGSLCPSSLDGNDGAEGPL
jgi:hypothetical protein